MELIFAFATDDGRTLKNEDHFGNARYYAIYRISPGKGEFIEQRSNIKVEEDEEEIHGDPNKARAVSSVLKGVNALVSKRFGPNIKRMVKKFVCIIVRTDSIEEALEIIESNMSRITQEYQKGEDRKHLVLTS